MFRQGTFASPPVIAIVFGVAMFAGIVYIPLFFQMVRGYSPTESGLLMIPMMAGIVLTSVLSGLVISRAGRYKWFLVAGSVVITSGSRCSPSCASTRRCGSAALYLLVLGIGMGMFMQPLVLAMQNIVKMEDLGVATSTNTFARTLGGAIGTSVLGAVMYATLDAELDANLPGRARAAHPRAGGGFRHERPLGDHRVAHRDRGPARPDPVGRAAGLHRRPRPRLPRRRLHRGRPRSS